MVDGDTTENCIQLNANLFSFSEQRQPIPPELWPVGNEPSTVENSLCQKRKRRMERVAIIKQKRCKRGVFACNTANNINAVDVFCSFADNAVTLDDVSRSNNACLSARDLRKFKNRQSAERSRQRKNFLVESLTFQLNEYHILVEDLLREQSALQLAVQKCGLQSHRNQNSLLLQPTISHCTTPLAGMNQSEIVCYSLSSTMPFVNYNSNSMAQPSCALSRHCSSLCRNFSELENMRRSCERQRFEDDGDAISSLSSVSVSDDDMSGICLNNSTGSSLEYHTDTDDEDNNESDCGSMPYPSHNCSSVDHDEQLTDLLNDIDFYLGDDLI